MPVTDTGQGGSSSGRSHASRGRLRPGRLNHRAFRHPLNLGADGVPVFCRQPPDRRQHTDLIEARIVVREAHPYQGQDLDARPAVKGRKQRGVDDAPRRVEVLSGRCLYGIAKLSLISLTPALLLA